MRTLALATLLVACGDPPPAPLVEVATPADAADFLSWPRTEVPTTDRFPHAVYANDIALRGEPWQPGAIFVRAEELGAHERWVVQGMLRRADPTFNTGGASGWELFVLTLGDGDRASVVWHGETPPAVVTTGGSRVMPDGDCNDCHHDPDPILSR